MDVTLGPWTVAKGVDKEYQSLADVMGDEARKTADKTAGFTPRAAENGKPAASGFTISGKITTVLKKGHSTGPARNPRIAVPDQRQRRPLCADATLQKRRSSYLRSVGYTSSIPVNSPG